MGSRDRELFGLLEPIVAAQGADLVEVGIGRAGRGSVIRLVIHSPAGVSHGDCARVTRAVGDALDAADVVAGSYTLEVSSPGLDRVLKEAREFELFRGQPVRLWLAEDDSPREVAGVSGGRRGADEIVIRTEDGSEKVIPWSRVSKVRLASKAASTRGLGGKGR